MEKTIGFIGSGAVATGLARAIVIKGVAVAAITGRNNRRVYELASETGAGHHGSRMVDALGLSDITFICLPDDSIAGETEKLSEEVSDISGKIVFHTSGSLTSSVLTPLKKRGAYIGSFHPLQTFPTDTAKEISMAGCAVALEGDTEAVEAGKEIALLLGSHPLVLSTDQKGLYHTAATIASNGLVALVGVIEELYGELDIGGDALRYYHQLMQQSLTNSMMLGAVQAITGPVARGDVTTLKRHIGELRMRIPHIVPIYVILGSHCVNIALQGGKITNDQAAEIMDLFSNELQSLTM
jgi:predicted short-subunit dehydrogenase-like oxidoreductase (DUF2520 family)